MSQILKKFIGDNEVGAAKIRLDNNDYLRSRNSADNGNINLIRANSSDKLEHEPDIEPTADNARALGSTSKRYLNMFSSALSLLGQGLLKLFDSDSSNSISIRAPATLSTDLTWTLPNSNGSNGQALTTDGAGTLAWSTVGGGGFPLLAPDGSAVNPSYAFTNQPDTGLFLLAGSSLALSVDGSTKMYMGATSTNFAQNIGTDSIGVSIGTTGTPFGTIASTQVTVKNNSNGDKLVLRGQTALTSPSGISVNPSLRTNDPNDTLGILTVNSGGTNGPSMYIETGRNTGSGSTGRLHIQTGPQGGTGGAATKTGDLELFSGNATGDGESGKVWIKSGSAANGNSGNIELEVGSSSSGTVGRIICTSRTIRLPIHASAPTATEAGEMYYDTGTNKSYTWDGMTWQAHWT